MKNYLLTFFCCFAFIACSTSKRFTDQNSDIESKIPNLTYAEMIQDYDSLVSYFKQVSPIIYFNKEVRDINFFKDVEILRKEITPKTTMLDYLKVIQKTINSAQDPHSHIMGSGHLDILKKYWIPNGDVKDIDTATIKYGYHYSKFLNDEFYTKSDLALIYTLGEYYNLLPFSYQGKLYPTSMKVISCNGLNIHEFVKNRTTLIPNQRWDRVNNRAYKETFYKPAELYKNGYLNLVFVDKKNQKYKLKLKKNDTVTFTAKKNWEFDYNNQESPIITHYFEKEKIFYAKLPMMLEEYGDSLRKKLEPIIAKNKINSIVIDIRGNPGGSDNTYNNFLKYLVKDTLKQDIVLGLNFSPYIQNHYKINRDSILSKPNYSFKVDVATLNTPVMYFTSIPNYKFVIPDSNTFAFSGNIYILQDRFIYSSASNLSNLASRSKRLVSIGETPDLLGGLQTDPIVLQLPNSKILFRIEPQIDLTNAKIKSDIFQNNVEYPVSYSIEELYLRTTTKKDIFGKDFLHDYDPMFKKVLEIEKKN